MTILRHSSESVQVKRSLQSCAPSRTLFLCSHLLGLLHMILVSNAVRRSELVGVKHPGGRKVKDADGNPTGEVEELQHRLLMSRVTGRWGVMMRASAELSNYFHAWYSWLANHEHDKEREFGDDVAQPAGVGAAPAPKLSRLKQATRAMRGAAGAKLAVVSAYAAAMSAMISPLVASMQGIDVRLSDVRRTSSILKELQKTKREIHEKYSLLWVKTAASVVRNPGDDWNAQVFRRDEFLPAVVIAYRNALKKFRHLKDTLPLYVVRRYFDARNGCLCGDDDIVPREVIELLRSELFNGDEDDVAALEAEWPNVQDILQKLTAHARCVARRCE